jgi:hypothetical protein
MANTNEVKNEKIMGLQWKWILIGLFFGLVITFLSMDLIAPNYPGSIMPTFIVMVIGFSIMGIFVGYLSPGITIKESSISGIIMIIIFLLYFSILSQISIPLYYIIVTSIVGFVFSLLGGWIGEVLQAQSPQKTSGLQWSWIAVGVVLGFLVSNTLLLILAPKYNERTVLYILSIGFIITGIIVGLKSPGKTILESTVAGVITVLLDYLFIIFITTQNISIYVFQEQNLTTHTLQLKITVIQIIGGFIVGLILALVGGVIGEALQERMERQK